MGEDIGTKLVKSLKPVYSPKNEKKLFKSIISALYDMSLDISEAETILYSVYDNLPTHDFTRTEIFQLNEAIFSEEIKPNGGIKSLERLLTTEYDKLTAKDVVKEISSILYPTGVNKTYKLEIGTNKNIVMDNHHSEVIYEQFTHTKDDIIRDYTKILLCYPHEVIVHNNPLDNQGRIFSITWRTKDNLFFKTLQMTTTEIESALVEQGYVLSHKYLKGVVTAIIQICSMNGLLIVKNEIETGGFYYDSENNKIIKVGYEPKPLIVDEVKQALLLIEDLGNYFKGHESKLATTLKHGLIAPYGFAKKQMGQPLELLIPYMYHFGKGGSGKTTIARIGLYFYERPEMNKNDIGGTEFDTVPRIGEQLRKSTFGLLVNEPENTFAKVTCVSALKTSAERTNARQKISGKRMEHILALAMVSIASNVPLPNVEGLPRRFVQILYSHNERKSQSEKEEFMEHFKTKNPNECLFNKLQFLANFAVAQIDKNIDLLQLDWKSLGNTLIEQAYDYCGMKVPQWLLEYVESITEDDLDEEETEEIRTFFINEINKASSKIKEYYRDSNVPVIEDYDDYVKNASDFQSRVFNIINNGLIPYIVLKEGNNYNEVCFTSKLKKELINQNINCYSLSSTAEQLGWNYKPVRINNGVSKCIVVDFDIFLEFLYPQMEDI